MDSEWEIIKSCIIHKEYPPNYDDYLDDYPDYFTNLITYSDGEKTILLKIYKNDNTYNIQIDIQEIFTLIKI